MPLVDLDVEQFSLPIAAYTTSYFLTARLAARRMIPNGSGVIMTVTALPARTGTRCERRLRPGAGRQGGAHARPLRSSSRRTASASSACGRTASRRPARCGRSSTLKAATGMTWEQFQEFLASTTHTRRLIDARGAGQRGRLHGVRPGERDDGNDRQPDHGRARRLAVTRASVPTRPRGFASDTICCRMSSLRSARGHPPVVVCRGRRLRWLRRIGPQGAAGRER